MAFPNREVIAGQILSKIYHITHIGNLAEIVATGGLFSDAALHKKISQPVGIGMGVIKLRRLTLPVKCHPPHCVGDFVPFYFCPRSVMLYLIHRSNHPDLNYKGGQEPIIHLEADLNEVLQYAKSKPSMWSFSTSNAGGVYAEFFAEESEFHRLNWHNIYATDFSSREVKEQKQAEFLLHDFFPFHLVKRIGVKSARVHGQVLNALSGTAYNPRILVMPTWYY